MKIAAAQIRPRIGEVHLNLARHLELISLAVEHQADLILFPELSLTGYEPGRAEELAVTSDAVSLAELQAASDKKGVTIVAGAPWKCSGLPRISALIFRPDQTHRMYSKRCLHEDEISYFAPGSNPDSVIHLDPVVSLAICYELSVKQHAEAAFAQGASVYLASVAKTAAGVVSAGERLSEIAVRHSALVMISNSVGEQDGSECAGGSAAWSRDGRLIAALDSTTEGVLVVDEASEEPVIALLA